MPDDQTYCGVVSVLGAPNAGKSTLVNRVVGAKVSIVSPKVQTTRIRVRGVSLYANTQIIYVDTPGIFVPKRRLDRAMVDAAWGGAADADAIILLVDAQRGVDKDTQRIIEGLNKRKSTASLVLNKVDAVRREDLLGLSEKLNGMADFSATFMVSALKGGGVNDLEAKLRTLMPEGALVVSRRTKFQICPSDCWLRKSPAKRPICICIRSSPMRWPWEPRAGKISTMGKCGSNRPSPWRGIPTRASLSARVGK